MATGSIQVYYGNGRGKTSAAFGRAIRSALKKENIFIIQFLKGKSDEDVDFLKRLEPEIKVFRFEKAEGYYESLSKDEQNEEARNIRNGLNFAKKVLATGECNLLILDEVLGLVDKHIIEEEELTNLIQARSADTDLILTGRVLSEQLFAEADEVYHIETEK